MSTVKSKKLQVGTDATSSNNFTIYQPATPDGTLRIGVGNADSPTEVGRFNSNGYVATNAPAFRAYLNADQTGISSATWTKVQIDTEEFDTNSCYDNSTNYRFTPTIAGYYQINFRVRNDSTSTRASDFSAIYKNGSLYSYANTALFSTAADVGMNGSDLIYFNGSTDYIEIYTYLNGASGNVDGGSTANTFVSGFLARAA